MPASIRIHPRWRALRGTVGLAAFARASLCAGDRRWRPARLLVAVGSVRLATPLANDLGRRVYLSFGLVDLGWAL